MAAGHTQDEGDYLPSAITSNDSPHTPSHGYAPAGPKRSLTPRGPLFLNLDEAHRNITSRLATNNPFRKPSGENQYTEEIALRDYSIPTITNNTGNMRSNALPRHATDFVLPHPSRGVAARSLTHRQDDSEDAPDKDHLGTSDTFKSGEVADRVKSTNTNPPDTSGSTVGRIVDQYATESLLSSLSNSDAAYTFSDVRQNYSFKPCPREGAATRLGFHGEELHGLSNTQDRVQRRESSLPPQPHSDCTEVNEQLHSQVNCPSATLNAESQSNNRLSHLPAIVHLDPRRSSLRHNSNMRSMYGLSTVAWPSLSSQASNFRDLREPSSINNRLDQTLKADNKEHKVTRSLIPLPLRITSSRDLRTEHKREPGQDRLDALFSDVESSVDENGSTEPSDADPFKYDNEKYHRIRHLGKEREVSQAMKHMTEVHTEVSLEHYNADDDSGRTDGILLAFQSAGAEDISRPPIRSGRPAGSFFDPVAFRALHGDVDHSHEREVKVIIKPSSPSPPDDFEDKGADSNTFGLTVERNNLPTGRSPHDLATDGDWITEATSEVGFNTIDTCAASQGIQLDRTIKVTGSSIADYSDGGLDSLPERLNSRNRILQHPSGESPFDSYEMRDLKDIKQVVFLPKSHIQRVNGFAQDSIRLRPNAPKPADRRENSQYYERLSNPFRRKSYKRADAGSYFQYRKDRNAPSKYEFRDSTSEYTPALDNNHAVSRTHETLASTSMASINTAELLGSDADPFTATSREHDGFPYGKRGSQKIKPTKSHSRRPAELLGAHQQSIFGDDDRPTPMTPTVFEDGSISATSKFKFPLLNLSVAQAIHKRRRESEETDEAENYGAREERVSSNTSSQLSQTHPISLPSAVYTRNKSDIRKGLHLSLTFTPPDWRTLESDQVMPDQDEYTPSSSTFRPLFDRSGNASQSPATPATYADAETPTLKKRGWFGQKAQSRRRLLPIDKRIRKVGSDRTLRSIIQRESETVQATEDHCISYKARTRRQYYFYTMMVLCILPFFAIIVLAGHCNAALSYFTSGEVYRLTKRQRRAIKILFGVECVVYGALVTGIVVYFGLNHRYSS